MFYVILFIPIIIIMSILPIVIAVKLAKERNENTTLWGILALLFGWIAVLILACISSGNNGKNESEQVDLLYKYKKMFEDGIITKKEFEDKKEEIFEHINKKKVVSENIIIEYPSYKITCVFDDGSQMVTDSVYSSFYYIKKELQEKGINKNVLYMMNENNDKIYDGESFVFK